MSIWTNLKTRIFGAPATTSASGGASTTKTKGPQSLFSDSGIQERAKTLARNSDPARSQAGIILRAAAGGESGLRRHSMEMNKSLSSGEGDRASRDMKEASSVVSSAIANGLRDDSQPSETLDRLSAIVADKSARPAERAIARSILSELSVDRPGAWTP